jgi:hypothetical protein
VPNEQLSIILKKLEIAEKNCNEMTPQIIDFTRNVEQQKLEIHRRNKYIEKQKLELV